MGPGKRRGCVRLSQGRSEPGARPGARPRCGAARPKAPAPRARPGRRAGGTPRTGTPSLPPLPPGAATAGEPRLPCSHPALAGAARGAGRPCPAPREGRPRHGTTIATSPQHPARPRGSARPWPPPGFHPGRPRKPTSREPAGAQPRASPAPPHRPDPSLGPPGPAPKRHARCPVRPRCPRQGPSLPKGGGRPYRAHLPARPEAGPVPGLGSVSVPVPLRSAPPPAREEAGGRRGEAVPPPGNSQPDGQAPQPIGAARRV